MERPLLASVLAYFPSSENAASGFWHVCLATTCTQGFHQVVSTRPTDSARHISVGPPLRQADSPQIRVTPHP
jgi:hypothetical protein